MCGIWCSLGFPATKEVINVINHRGPDGEGWCNFDTVRGPLSLGHRRLNIIDKLTNLKQPYSSFCGLYWIVYNGEIYNYLQIKSQLQKLGYNFSTNTDTEVVLYAYVEWKEAAITKFNGMFSFVIYDKARNILYAARDQFGIKPMFLFYNDTGVCFSSEIKQILKLGLIIPKANLSRCIDYIHYGITNHTSETMFENIYEVRAGESITFEISLNSRPVIKKWKKESVCRYTFPESIDILSQELEELLTHSINLQLKGDVPIGLCLSGGLDSSAINAFARYSNPQMNITSFSVLNKSTEVDESTYVASVVNYLNICNKGVNLNFDDFLPHIEKILWHQDEPFGGTSLFAQWKLFDFASSHGAKVLLCGQGADELFAGYNHLRLIHRAYRAKELGISKCAKHLDENEKRYNHQFNYLLQELIPTEDYKMNIFGINNKASVNSVCRNMISTSSLPMLLRYEDRNSMAHGIEARVPFLENNLAAFALELDSDYKIYAGLTKYLLRYVLIDKLPDLIIKRRQKIGFTTPEHIWLKNEKLISLIKNTITELIPSWRHIFSRKIVKEFFSGSAHINNSNMFYIWRIFCFLLWTKMLNITP